MSFSTLSHRSINFLHFTILTKYFHEVLLRYGGVKLPTCKVLGGGVRERDREREDEEEEELDPAALLSSLLLAELDEESDFAEAEDPDLDLRGMVQPFAPMTRE
eukprot:CAMPEP_0174357402 /NCGR_PEP_ID=MMETSP0811_2-20130205/35908_1 /TAXON_ID=73025 ORGANISM="Eutreptiella gymnastica-like, Strain CCMP1594" /NCGR_SAMPLE_ID=MMETSP0811_2 /ASSEMBLY_ACC=CAM_ASM_000667 /LENGTH=103 /DNA_ID=CAMNT_0015490203 /DNA_START=477 /DNA_END=786 /DNA_ORIENTATION=-